MIKNILSTFIFLFSIFFFLFVSKVYFSDQQKKKIKFNRELVFKKIEKNLINLQVLPADTNNVIEFNTGFDDENNKTKRNFWKLFTTND
tara:strand:+ start:60 stop:326 length:267 start_codon:yes stop_codon:yes gene_type:complete